MQRTRLNQLVDQSRTQIERWLSNPWRLTSMYIIGFLAGFLFANILSTGSGAQSRQDVLIAFITLLFTEWISGNYYSQAREKRTALADIIHWFKLGLIYGLFLDAFKLGS